jgi:hypothetical protein
LLLYHFLNQQLHLKQKNTLGIIMIAATCGRKSFSTACPHCGWQQDIHD